MTHLLYVQGTGNVYRSSGDARELVLKAYSGKGAHKNNPPSQCVTDMGPIPVGWYNMSLLAEWKGMKNVVELTPNPENKMCGRSEFLIHGDSVADPGNASSGCIIVNDAEVRAKLCELGQLEVIAQEVSLVGLLGAAALKSELRSEKKAYSSKEEAEIDKLEATEDVALAGHIPFRLGSGYRSHALQFGNRIINHEALASPEPSEARVETKIGLVLSKEDFESVLNADASIAGSAGGFSGSAKASLEKRFNRNQTSVAIAFTRKVVRGFYRIAQFPILSVATNEAKDPHKFVRAFGDSIVTGVGLGGACCYIFNFNFSSETEASNFKAEVSARYGPSSGSASMELRQKLERVNASVEFSGFTTGTLKVPDLFPPEITDGMSYLFSTGFASQMISGLLDYFDRFPSYFETEDNFKSYSQCDIEIERLADMPTLFKTQDKIVKLGQSAKSKADLLRRHGDYLQALDGQLTYAKTIQYCVVPDAHRLIDDIQARVGMVRDKVAGRLENLLVDADFKAEADFSSEIPALPPYLSTADPSVDVRTFTSPRGYEAFHEFPIGELDGIRTCWVQVNASICAVGHRPNGGNLWLRLICQTNSVSPKFLSGRPVEVEEAVPVAPSEVDEQTAHVAVSRNSAEVSVSCKEAFVPLRDGIRYKIGIVTEGNYRCGSTLTLVTRMSRQSRIVM